MSEIFKKFTDQEATLPVPGKVNLYWTPDDEYKAKFSDGTIAVIYSKGALNVIPKANTFAELPPAASNTGEIYVVATSTGIWPFRKYAGLYYSDGVNWITAPDELVAEIINNTNNISSNTTNIATNVTNIASNLSAINQEVTDRQNADTNLQNQINALALNEVFILGLSSSQDVNTITSTTLDYSNTILNNIAGASVASGVVTLPIGNYRVSYNFSGVTVNNQRKNIGSNILVNGSVNIVESSAYSYARNLSDPLATNVCHLIESSDLNFATIGTVEIIAARFGSVGAYNTIVNSGILRIEKI